MPILILNRGQVSIPSLVVIITATSSVFYANLKMPTLPDCHAGEPILHGLEISNQPRIELEAATK